MKPYYFFVLRVRSCQTSHFCFLSNPKADLNELSNRIDALRSTIIECCINSGDAAQHTSPDTNDALRDRSRAVLLFVNALRDRIFHLMQRRVRDNSDFDWQILSRAYIVQGSTTGASSGMLKSSTIIIKVADQHATYGFHPALIGRSTNISLAGEEKVLFNLARFAQSGQISLLVGPRGCGKTQTASTYASLIGRAIFTYNAASSSALADFEGLPGGGLWVSFLRYLHGGILNGTVLLIDNFAALAQLQSAASAISAIVEKVMHAVHDRKLSVSTGDINVGEMKLREGFCLIAASHRHSSNANFDRLPVQLRTLTRPIALMAFEGTVVCNALLAAAGDSSSWTHARKLNLLFDMAEQQLSKQMTYDFSKRRMVQMTKGMCFGRLAFVFQRVIPKSAFVMRLRQEILPSLIAEDIPLFLAILGDVFGTTGADLAESDEGAQTMTDVPRSQLASTLKSIATSYNNLADGWISRIVHIYEALIRHRGVVLVGSAGVGKTR